MSSINVNGSNGSFYAENFSGTTAAGGSYNGVVATGTNNNTGEDYYYATGAVSGPNGYASANMYADSDEFNDTFYLNTANGSEVSHTAYNSYDESTGEITHSGTSAANLANGASVTATSGNGEFVAEGTTAAGDDFTIVITA